MSARPAAIKKAGGVDLTVGLQRQLAAINKDFRNVGRPFADVGRAGAVFARNMTLIGAAIGGTVAGVLAFTRAGTEAVDQAGKMAQQLGLSVDAFGRPDFAAKQSGATVGELRTGLQGLNRRIGEAVGGNDKAAELFERLGVSITDAAGAIRPLEEIVADVADGFAALPDGAQKSALALQLLGETGARLLPLFNQGSEGLRQLGPRPNDLASSSPNSNSRSQKPSTMRWPAFPVLPAASALKSPSPLRPPARGWRMPSPRRWCAVRTR